MKSCLIKIVTGEKKGPHVEVMKVFLWLLSLVYLLVVKVRVYLYQAGIFPSEKLPKPVISIGNITVGGTGKTPLVVYIAKKIKARGKKPVILMRGYMPGAEESDEAALLREELEVPVLVGADRVASAKKYLQDGACDCFIMDDGFQHLKLKRDLDIVALDAIDPWGRGFCLPRGFLREPVHSLKRAAVIVLTKTDQVKPQAVSLAAQVNAIHPGVLVCSSVHQARELLDARTLMKFPPDFIKGQKAAALSALGSPAGFERMLVHYGAVLMRHFTFMDHHVYTENDIKPIAQFCRDQNIKFLVMTEKDRVKLDKLLNLFPDDVQLLSLKIHLTITDNEDALLKRIADLS